MSVAVALFTRAWIEITATFRVNMQGYVALFTRAWIEILLAMEYRIILMVALFTRAWIEIRLAVSLRQSITSPSSRGRGLKYLKLILVKRFLSRPLHEGVD